MRRAPAASSPFLGLEGGGLGGPRPGWRLPRAKPGQLWPWTWVRRWVDGEKASNADENARDTGDSAAADRAEEPRLAGLSAAEAAAPGLVGALARAVLLALMEGGAAATTEAAAASVVDEMFVATAALATALVRAPASAPARVPTVTPARVPDGATGGAGGAKAAAAMSATVANVVATV